MSLQSLICLHKQFLMIVDIFSSFDPATLYIFSLSSTLFWITSMLVFSSIFSSIWPMAPSSVSPLYSSIELINTQSQRSFILFIKGARHLLAALFILIIFLNIIGLCPYVFRSTGHLLLTLAFGLPLWLGIIIRGVAWNTKEFIAHFLPSGAPDWLNPFLVLIETVRISVRFITLSFRLGANITAGHIVLGLIGVYCTAAVFTSLPSLIIIILTQSFFTLFEIGVALIQAYIFCLLLTLYSDDHPH